MPVTLRKMSEALVQRPTEPGKAALFLDEDGNPRYLEATGPSKPAASLIGGPLELVVQGAAPATAAGTSKLYAKRVAGRAEAFVLDGDGNEVQLTSGGALAAGAASGDPSFWYDGGTAYEHDILYTGSSGPQVTDTGLVVPFNTPNVMITTFFRLNAVSTSASYTGWIQRQNVWPTAPGGAFDLEGATLFHSAGSPGLPTLPYSALAVNAQGTIEVTIDSADSFRGGVLIDLHIRTGIVLAP